MFERHIGKPAKDISLNAYSSNPEQIEQWFLNAKKAQNICGKVSKKISNEEISSINSLKRGVFLRNDLKKGNSLKIEDVFFAMPFIDKQLESGSWCDGIVLNSDVKKMNLYF